MINNCVLYVIRDRIRIDWNSISVTCRGSLYFRVWGSFIRLRGNQRGRGRNPRATILHILSVLKRNSSNSGTKVLTSFYFRFCKHKSHTKPKHFKPFSFFFVSNISILSPRERRWKTIQTHSKSQMVKIPPLRSNQDCVDHLAYLIFFYVSFILFFSFSFNFVLFPFTLIILFY